MLTLVKQIRVARYQSVPFQHLRFTEMSDLGGNFVTDQTNLNLLGAETIQGKDPKASNTLESPNPIVRQPINEISIKNGKAVEMLPPFSFSAATFTLI